MKNASSFVVSNISLTLTHKTKCITGAASTASCVLRGTWWLLRFNADKTIWLLRIIIRVTLTEFREC